MLILFIITGSLLFITGWVYIVRRLDELNKRVKGMCETLKQVHRQEWFL